MSRWFRHYAGMMRDDKLVSAAIRSKQPVERVVWVWGAILESAAEIDDEGLFRFDAAEAAYFLRTDEADICAIVDALTDAGRLAADRVVRWGDRQFKSDRSAERQARYRDGKRGTLRHGDDQQASPDGRVTSLSRHGDAPEAETELETEKTQPPAPLAEVGARDLIDEIWDAFPRNPSSSQTKARAAIRATKARDHDAILAAARRYAQWFAEDCAARKRTIDAGLKFVPHLATWIETGGWQQADALPVRGLSTVESQAAMAGIEYVDRVSQEALFRACERIRDKPAHPDIQRYGFPREIVDRARAEGHEVSA